MSAAFRIVFDVLVYRVRRLEMANMVAAVSLSLALALPGKAIAERALFALVLNVLAYLTNDYYDVDRDLEGGRAPEKTRFLADNRRAAVHAQLGLAALLVAMAVVIDVGLLIPAVAGAGICWAYSAKLKCVPVVDVLSMTLWGATMPLVGAPIDNPMGWALAGQLALFSTCFELIQVVRDADEDRAAGIETTAVRFGVRAGRVLVRVAIVLAALYAVLVVHRVLGVALLGALLVPFGDDTSRYWNRIRGTFGVLWILMLGAVYLAGGASGVLF